MSKRKLYFRTEDSENCHDKEYFQSEMRDDGVTEMVVFEAIPDKSKDYFWCGAVDAVYLNSDGDSCGKDCDSYIPCNGKSGKCKFKTHCYTHGEKITLKLKEVI